MSDYMKMIHIHTNVCIGIHIYTKVYTCITLHINKLRHSIYICATICVNVMYEGFRVLGHS